MSTAKPAPKPAAVAPQQAPALEMPDARRRLQELARRALGDVAVSFAPPGADETKRGIGLYLLELGTAAKQPHSLQFSARFLVTVAGPDPAAACDDLAEFTFAALAEPDIEVDAAPLPAAAWTAFGAVPRPSLTLSVLLRRSSRAKPAVPVRETVLQLTQR